MILMSYSQNYNKIIIHKYITYKIKSYKKSTNYLKFQARHLTFHIKHLVKFITNYKKTTILNKYNN